MAPSPGADSAGWPARAAADGDADAPRRRRLIAKIRDHPVKSILMAGIGLWASNLVVVEMAKSLAAWVFSPPLIAAMLVGGTASALLSYLLVPSAFARAYADFWEIGAFGRFAVELAFALMAALGWAFLLMTLFGTRTVP